VSEETPACYPDGGITVNGEPMRNLKDRYIAPAISAFPPSMAVKLEFKSVT